MKTARFTDLVKKAGAPNPYLLWVSPKKDNIFQRAVKEQRVLTIHQENVGTKKDYGMVGFHQEPNAQYLVFPKSLKAFGDPAVDPRVLSVMRRAMKDLDAGKTVAAYKRLEALVAEAEGEGG